MTDAVRDALAEILELCAIGDVDECTEALGWGKAIQRARAALSEQPAPRVCKGIPRVGCNYLAECDSVCNKCGKVHAVHLIPGVGSTAPVERVPLSDEQVLACIRSAQVGPVPMGMTRERGPYDVTEPTYFAQRFARAVIAEYERLSGISATPRRQRHHRQAD